LLLAGNITGMSIDSKALAEGMTAAVPFARTLGIEFAELTLDGDDVRVVATMADAERLHNHVAGPHAGALFSLGETASGAVVLAAFAPHLSLGTPLAVRAEIAYAKLARGAVRATATLGRKVAEVVDELSAGGRPEFPVHVEIARADGAVTTTMTVTWTIRPNG
jgi:acyl-coenzyme A thioesterase PaaI-like protein